MGDGAGTKIGPQAAERRYRTKRDDVRGNGAGRHGAEAARHQRVSRPGDGADEGRGIARHGPLLSKRDIERYCHLSEIMGREQKEKQKGKKRLQKVSPTSGPTRAPLTLAR